MRAKAFGLIALPVVAVGGASVAAAVVALGSAGQPEKTPPGQTATAGITGEASDEPSLSVEGDENADDTATTVDGSDGDGSDFDGSDFDGTVIDGSKPYLTVIEGMSTLPVPAPLPAMLAEVSVRAVSLAPLPPPPGRRVGPVEPADGAAEENRGQIRTDPALRNPLVFPGSETGPGGQPPAPGSQPDPGTRPGGGDGTGGGDGAGGGDDRGDGTPGGSPGRPAVPAPDSVRPPADPSGPPVLGGPPVGPPPLADETGPPPLAGETGRPPHAGAPVGRPPAAGSPVGGRPPAIDAPVVDAPAVDSPAKDLPTAGSPVTDPPADSGTPAVPAAPAAPADGDTDPAEGTTPHPSDDHPTAR